MTAHDSSRKFEVLLHTHIDSSSSTTYYLSLFKRNGYFIVVIPMIRIPTGLCTFNSPESCKSGKKFNKMSNGIRAMKPRFKFDTNLYKGGRVRLCLIP